MTDTKWVKIVLDELGEIKEDLLTLYEDIRDSDTRDAAARRETLAVLGEFNEKLEPLERAVDDMLEFIERVTHVSAQRDVEAPISLDAAASARAVQILDREEPHSLDEHFTFKKPYGFKLAGQPHTNIPTWTQMHREVLIQLAQHDPERFGRLPEIAEFNRNLGSRFDRDPKKFRKPLKLPLGLYCEGHLSARTIRDNIRGLLAYFNILERELVIYLREDRNAEEAG